MTIARPTAALLAACLAAACTGGGVTASPADEPYAVGTVAELTHRATASLVLVRALPGSPEPCGIAATVDASTTVLERAGSGGARRIAVADLAIGDTVEVYVEGPVAESCPPQGTATTVIRLRGR